MMNSKVAVIGFNLLCCSYVLFDCLCMLCELWQVDEYVRLKEKLEKEVQDVRKREQQLTLGEQQVW